MATEGSNNSMLYFIVGALLVAVIAVGYLAMNKEVSSAAPTGAGAPASENTSDSGTQFKLDVNKDGEVSGSIEKKSGE